MPFHTHTTILHTFDKKVLCGVTFLWEIYTKIDRKHNRNDPKKTDNGTIEMYQ